MANHVLTIISSELVPTATDTTSVSRLNLTPWDLQLLLLDSIQKGLLFRNPQPFASVVDRLKTSFSRALSFFPPLAGRLVATTDDGETTLYSVHCNNAGAVFSHATATGVSVSDVSEAKHTPEIVSSFFPLNGVRNFEGVSNPLFGVQVTELADGFFIGCTANHTVVDGNSFWHFINSWAEISRGSDKPSKSPVFERSNPTIAIPALEKNLSPGNWASPQLVERVFHFGKSSVAALKAKANKEAENANISSFQSLLAHLLKCMTRCRGKQTSSISSSSQEIETLLTIGARARIPLPDGYFGNAYHPVRFKISEGELVQNGVGQTGLKIHKLISQHGCEAAVLGFVEDWVKNPVLARKGGSITLLVSSSPRYDVYGNDFGWGRPVAVRSGKGQKMDGKMTFFPGPEWGSIDVEVCAAADTLRALEEDGEFMDVGSTRN